jgi:hypothetical protein
VLRRGLMYSPDEAKAKVGRLRPTSYLQFRKTGAALGSDRMVACSSGSLFGVFVVVRFVRSQVMHIGRCLQVAIAPFGRRFIFLTLDMVGQDVSV